jgi:hypothetical protein
LQRAVEVALAYEAELCSGLEPSEREQLIDLLLKLQAGGLLKRGVHPGITQEHPGAPGGR